MARFAARLAALGAQGSGLVRLVRDDAAGIAVMTLSNPERRNALSGPMMKSIAEHVAELERWDNGAGLIITGDGGTFCSGLDLGLAKEELQQPQSGREVSDRLPNRRPVAACLR